MAKFLNISPSRISRELKRNSYKTRYVPTDAHRKYKERRKNCHRQLQIDIEVKEYLEEDEIEQMQL